MGGNGKLFKPKTRHVFPMRYNSESLEIKLVISVNVVLFKDIKISFGAFNYCTENARSISGKSLPRDVNNCK